MIRYKSSLRQLDALLRLRKMELNRDELSLMKANAHFFYASEEVVKSKIKLTACLKEMTEMRQNGALVDSMCYELSGEKTDQAFSRMEKAQREKNAMLSIVNRTKSEMSASHVNCKIARKALDRLTSKRKICITNSELDESIDLLASKTLKANGNGYW